MASFPSIMCVKFIHIDASDRSFLFISVYFMAEICHSLSILLLMELGVFPHGVVISSVSGNIPTHVLEWM